MTTRTIRETDITITIKSLNGYRLLEPGTGFQEGVNVWADHGVWHRTYAEALQARADIIDMRAGAAQVGDVVRVGLKGQATYIVGAIMPWGELRLTSESNDRTVRYFMPERVHVVRAER